jgi:2-oxo-4-hydroxy-4-carboxy-5-ureidoimidazoline decarboxylase
MAESYTWRLIKFAEADFLKCCGSRRWASAMAAHSFPNAKEVMATADSIWWGLSPEDWQEAFAMQRPMAARTDLSEATPSVMTEIVERAITYEQRFGWPFVATAVGKTATYVLRSLQERLPGEPAAELRVSAEQQLQITHNRLKRLLARQ